jgi:hypothetical protein
MEIVTLERSHARQVAQIHIEGQPGTFLTNLGEEVLTTLYEEIIASKWGFGIAAVEGDLVIGVIIITSNRRELFNYLKYRCSWRLLWPLLKQLIRKPGLLRNILDSLRYPQKISVGTKGGEGNAEYLFLGVRKGFQRQHVGFALCVASIGACLERGICRLVALIDSGNYKVKEGLKESGQKYGIKYDLQLLRTITLNNRQMDVMLINLDSQGAVAPVAGEVATGEPRLAAVDGTTMQGENDVARSNRDR